MITFMVTWYVLKSTQYGSKLNNACSLLICVAWSFRLVRLFSTVPFKLPVLEAQFELNVSLVRVIDNGVYGEVDIETNRHLTYRVQYLLRLGSGPRDKHPHYMPLCIIFIRDHATCLE